jgi:hypothetical protein
MRPEHASNSTHTHTRMQCTIRLYFSIPPKTFWPSPCFLLLFLSWRFAPSLAPSADVCHSSQLRLQHGSAVKHRSKTQWCVERSLFRRIWNVWDLICWWEERVKNRLKNRFGNVRRYRLPWCNVRRYYDRRPWSLIWVLPLKYTETTNQEGKKKNTFKTSK